MKRFPQIVAASLSLSLLWTTLASARTLPANTRPSRRTIQSQVEKSKPTRNRYPTVSSVVLSRTFENEAFGVRIQYPGDWTLQDQEQKDANLTLVMMVLSPAATAKDNLRENVNLVVEELTSESMTLDAYTKIGLDKEQAFFQGFRLSSKQRVLAGRYNAQQVEFTADVNGRTIAYRQVWFLKGKRAYVWTFADHPDTFPKNIAVFERMMDTMKVE